MLLSVTYLWPPDELAARDIENENSSGPWPLFVRANTMADRRSGGPE